jgi:hypothetical protein
VKAGYSGETPSLREDALVLLVIQRQRVVG